MEDETSKKHRRNRGYDNLIPWQPGQSGNPAGRPKKENCLTSILKERGGKRAMGGFKSGDRWVCRIARFLGVWGIVISCFLGGYGFWGWGR